MNHEHKLTGGCACGAVRYKSTVTQLFGIHCHCRQCQQVSGTGHASSFALPVDAVIIDGALNTYELTADSGNQVPSRFCPRCGSPVLKTTAGSPNNIYFHAATLDDPGQFRADHIVYPEMAPAWDSVRLNQDIPVEREGSDEQAS